MQLHGAGVRGQRLTGHARSQIGTADAEGDHMPDRRAAEAAHAALAHGIGKAAGARQFRFDFRRQLAAPGWIRVGAATQRDMQHGAALGGVDGLAGEHGVALRFDARVLRQGQQRFMDSAADALPREVQFDAGSRQARVVAAARLVHQFTQMRQRLRRQRGESPPCRAFGQPHHASSDHCTPSRAMNADDAAGPQVPAV
ncbi:hypothetical protein D9M72_382380 [compost metagenome]